MVGMGNACFCLAETLNNFFFESTSPNYLLVFLCNFSVKRYICELLLQKYLVLSWSGKICGPNQHFLFLIGSNFKKSSTLKIQVQMICLFFCANVCSSDIYQLCKLAYFDNWRSQKPLIHIKPNWADMAYYWSLSKLCVTNRPPSKITVVTAINYGLR
jgi:hypothetical protein